MFKIHWSQMKTSNFCLSAFIKSSAASGFSHTESSEDLNTSGKTSLYSCNVPLFLQEKLSLMIIFLSGLLSGEEECYLYSKVWSLASRLGIWHILIHSHRERVMWAQQDGDKQSLRHDFKWFTFILTAGTSKYPPGKLAKQHLATSPNRALFAFFLHREIRRENTYSKQSSMQNSDYFPCSPWLSG